MSFSTCFSPGLFQHLLVDVFSFDHILTYLLISIFTSNLLPIASPSIFLHAYPPGLLQFFLCYHSKAPAMCLGKCCHHFLDQKTKQKTNNHSFNYPSPCSWSKATGSCFTRLSCSRCWFSSQKVPWNLGTASVFACFSSTYEKQD